jgi:GTP-binding protein
MAPTIIIVGRPNVGKSTLFNRLSKSRDALVDNSPGITRDRLYASIIHNRIHFDLVDTGGFDDTGQALLSKSVKVQVELAIEDADRIIFMVDGRQGIMPGDYELAKTLRRTGKKIILAVNKLDGPEHENLLSDFYKLGLDFNFAISAAHGYGVKRLMDEVTKDLPNPRSEKYNDAVIRVAVLGKPNVGKSSLINKILGSDRLLVSELPGTTRNTEKGKSKRED